VTACQTVPAQPGPQLAFAEHALLQRLQRGQLGAGGRQLRRGALLGLLGLLPRMFEVRYGVFERLSLRRADRLFLLQRALLLLQIGQTQTVGSDDTALFGAQPLGALAQLFDLLRDAALLRGLGLQRLLRGRGVRTFVRRAQLRLTQRRFQRRQALALLLRAGLCHFGLHLRVAQPLRRVTLLLHRGGQTLLPLGLLRGHGLQRGLRPLPGVVDEADFRLQLADARLRRVKRRLRAVERVVAGELRLTQLLDRGFDAAQLGQTRVQRSHRLAPGLRHLLAPGLGLVAAQQPDLLLHQLRLRLQRLVAAGDLCLLFQVAELAAEFAQNVLHAGEVFARVLQPAFGFAPALLVARHSGGFFEHQAQVFGARLQDPGDRALADDGVGARPQPGAEEHVLHVAAPHRLVVDEIARRAVAGEHALDRQLAELPPLPADAAVAVVEHHFDAAAAGRLALRAAVENHVLHRFAAQLAGLAFAQHPAHGVDHVRLAASIRADDAADAAGKRQRHRVSKRLEPGQPQRSQTHQMTATL